MIKQATIGNLFSEITHVPALFLPILTSASYIGVTEKRSQMPKPITNYEPYWPENSQDFEQGVATYDPQAAGDAQRIARYTPIWYCPWVAVEP